MKSAHLHYLLDENGEPYQVQDVHEWAQKFPDQHIIARDEIRLRDAVGINPKTSWPGSPNFVVSTAFLGGKGRYDSFGKMLIERIPLLFETVVCGADGDPVDVDQWQDLEQAKRGHAFKLARWRKSLGVDPA